MHYKPNQVNYLVYSREVNSPDPPHQLEGYRPSLRSAVSAALCLCELFRLGEFSDGSFGPVLYRVQVINPDDWIELDFCPQGADCDFMEPRYKAGLTRWTRLNQLAGKPVASFYEEHDS